MSPQVRVIVVNHNGGADLRRCLEALSAQTMTEFEVIVVDNASSDGSAVCVKDADGRFTLLPLSENVGFAAANNRGAEDVNAELIATLNPDAFPQADWLERLCAAAADHRDVAMFGSTQISDRDPSRFDGVGDAYLSAGIPWRGEHGRAVTPLPPLAKTFSPCAAAALYRRDAFESIGGFDEAFFCYCEDIDLGFRLRLQGQRCFQVADARVRHIGSASTGKRSTFAIYHGARNRIWVMVKNMPLPLLVIALPLHAVTLLPLTLRAAMHRGEIRAMWRGVWHALLGLGPMLRKRREIQRSATVGWLTIARAMTWSPWRYLGRRADLRPLDQASGQARRAPTGQ
ncbi:MAG: glycosyltransferase family 2 protein [Alphaproteobacteria bacterium]|nr:glycosyltransferase family 2 protein [Alphaproteobacteria bacterium]